MQDLLLVVILLLIVGLAAWYVYKAKKSGHKCIGCPNGCCSKKNDGAACNGGCSCCGEE